MKTIKLPNRYGTQHYLEQCHCDVNGEKYVYRCPAPDNELPAGYSVDTDTNRLMSFDPSGGPFLGVGGQIDGKIIAAIQIIGTTPHVYLVDTEERASELAEMIDSGITVTAGSQSVEQAGAGCCKKGCVCTGTTESPMPVVIGMIGKAGSGKDTVADYLVERYGYTKLAFADPLKKAVQVMFDIDDEHMFDREKREEVLAEWKPWSVRKLLQFVGTELMRQQVDEDIWMKNAVSRAKKLDLAVISDARFPNEVDGVREMLRDHAKVVFIRVSRPGHADALGGIKGHASEAMIDALTPDIDIINDGSMEDLYGKVDSILTEMTEAWMIGNSCKKIRPIE